MDFAVGQRVRMGGYEASHLPTRIGTIARIDPHHSGMCPITVQLDIAHKRLGDMIAFAPSSLRPAPYVQRHTHLHPHLWAPYKIVAYANGFAGAPGEADLPPVYEPNAMVIGETGHACMRYLGEAATLDDAIEACWIHLAGITA